MCCQETKLSGNGELYASVVNGSGPKSVSNGAHMAVTSPTATENCLPICQFFLSSLSTSFCSFIQFVYIFVFWADFRSTNQ